MPLPKSYKVKVVFLRKYDKNEYEDTDHVIINENDILDTTDKVSADIVSDVLVSLVHYINNRKLFAILIGLFVFIPSVILNFISFYWWKVDLEEKEKLLKTNNVNLSNNFKKKIKYHLLCSILQIGPLSWYFKALKSSIKVYKERNDPYIDKKAKKKLFLKLIEAERDSSLLRFFEAILESMPQTLVQGYFILDQYIENKIEWSLLIIIQISSVIISLISVCTSLTVQHKALRLSRDDKNNMLLKESLLQGLWRFFTLFSRYLVLILFTYYLQKWLILFIIIHNLLSGAHIFSLQSLETGDNSRYLDFCLLIINIIIHIFLPFNMAEGSTLWRYIIGYLIEIIEYINLLVIMYFNPLNKSLPHEEYFILIPLFSLSLGIACMITYYFYLHPSKNELKRNEIEMSDNHRDEENL